MRRILEHHADYILGTEEHVHQRRPKQIEIQFDILIA